MKINDLKGYFLSVKTPKFYLTDVFSWRGNYNEVAFTVSTNGTIVESLSLIDKALNEKFDGYKGGEYSYDNETNVHFEKDDSTINDISLYELLLKHDF